MRIRTLAAASAVGVVALAGGTWAVTSAAPKSAAPGATPTASEPSTPRPPRLGTARGADKCPGHGGFLIAEPNYRASGPATPEAAAWQVADKYFDADPYTELRPVRSGDGRSPSAEFSVWARGRTVAVATVVRGDTAWFVNTVATCAGPDWWKFEEGGPSNPATPVLDPNAPAMPRPRCGGGVTISEVLPEYVVGKVAAPTPRAAVLRSNPQHFSDKDAVTLVSREGPTDAVRSSETYVVDRGARWIGVVTVIRGSGGWAATDTEVCG